MTTRLKRKLGDLGVDTASTKANESFCLIGTPLPPLEKSKDTGEFVPLWKQDVRDEKGRRRLHGAFTGGFSAGYFNTVGSKEGWTPSTFVSSRNDRAKKKQTRAEDFMDEEDLQEIQESRKLVDTTDEMDLTGGTQAELSRRGGAEEETETDAMATALQAVVLPPTKDSAGARILKKMGWRLGQGIGPRVTLRQRRLQDLQAATGRIVTGEDLDLSLDDEEANKHTYAPRDTPVLIVDRKDNFHGLGYRPGTSLNESLGGQKASSAGRSGPGISAGFGLGALNDADEDDLDVYDTGSSHRTRLAYDAIDADGDDRITIGAKGDLSRCPLNIKPTTGTETFRDGTLVLPGFMLYDKPVAEDKWFPLPDIPKGWQPNPKKLWDQEGPDKENIKKEEISNGPVPHHTWKSGMSAEERGNLLGETPLPSAPKSVFDYMSQKDRERLKNIAAGIASGSSLPSSGSASASTPTSIRIPSITPDVASAALRGFQPFTTDPKKQARYTLYLQSQTDPTTGTTLHPLPNQTVDEFNKELDEYAKSAQIFKPMSGAMAGRFTSAAVVEHGPKVQEGLHTPTVKEQTQTEEDEKGKRQKELTPKENAAKLGMYGPMTREVVPWQPARLLCKRFGLKDPNPEMSAGGADTSSPDMASTSQTDGVDAAKTTSSSGLSQQQIEAATASMWDTTARAGGGTSQGKRDLSNVGLGEDDSQGRDTLTYERPSIDVFKAIFASDDEGSDEDGDEDAVDGKEDDEKEAESSAALVVSESSKKSIPTDESVDLATFKPTFVPREARVTKSDDKDKDSVGSKKKKKKDKEKRKAIVSFAMDEGGDGADEHVSTEHRPKKKKKHGHEKGKNRDKDRDRNTKSEKSKQIEENLNDDDEDMWVERPRPTGVEAQTFDVDMLPAPANTEDGIPPPSRARKRAIDFM
ncbi:hypothetical protein E1B28_007785 [Marasmius oreades]|uniref:G-patch domain-containing protein n=1 Tax=Marasmius oreades TaxID=181124 RepID=A0A9P7S3R6_9AGAR|nr:uncharacterized protein E1B28_007785 [Marasmius oreades]KAG7094176.1 hypothetical protein E1B28_007785 [Marasmius oreades]